MVETGLQEVDNYVSRFHNIVRQFIATRTIMELCWVILFMITNVILL